ncbi:MAG: hypothetical protein J5629_00650 [Muribaculaceae bacterium]|nr:hypothetical protein [Muribaculaceae bacterium]
MLRVAPCPSVSLVQVWGTLQTCQRRCTTLRGRGSHDAPTPETPASPSGIVAGRYAYCASLHLLTAFVPSLAEATATRGLALRHTLPTLIEMHAALSSGRLCIGHLHTSAPRRGEISVRYCVSHSVYDSIAGITPVGHRTSGRSR